MIIFVKNVYDYSPISVQNLLVSAKGAEFRVLRSSTRRIKATLRTLNALEGRTKGEQQRSQIDRLRDLLRGAFTRVPYYRQLAKSEGYVADDFRSLDDLARLPILEKADLRGREAEFIDEAFSKRRLIWGATSGTTGTPLRFAQTQESFSDRFAFVGRLRSWAGVDPFFPRRAQFTGRDLVPTRQENGPFWRHNWTGNALLFSTSHISPASAHTYANALVRLTPDLIDGYPSGLAALAKMCLHSGYPLPAPKAVITTAETLFPADRAVIEEAFQTRVFNQYAASEPSCFWSECEAGRLHVHPEYGISEIVDADGHPAEEGDVVVTSLINPVMPLVRYRLGDRARWARDGETCSCGRSFPLVATVLGRTDDVLYVPERGYVGRLDPVFKGMDGIIEAQIVQDQLDRVRVRLVPSDAFGEDHEATLISNVKAKVGTSTEVVVERVGQIKRGKNGKFPAVVSLVRDQYPSLDGS